MRIYQLYQEAYARNDNTIMIAPAAEPQLIVKAYDENHQWYDDALGDLRLLKNWYVGIWEDGQRVGLLLVDDLRDSHGTPEEEIDTSIPIWSQPAIRDIINEEMRYRPLGDETQADTVEAVWPKAPIDAEDE